MDIVALGQACEVLCGMPDDRIRGRDPVAIWLRQHRRDGMFASRAIRHPWLAGTCRRGAPAPSTGPRAMVYTMGTRRTGALDR